MARKGHLRFENADGVTTDLVPSINDFRVIEAAVEILEKCKITTKLFEQEKIPTVPLVTERLYTVDQELSEFISNAVNKRTKKKAVMFATVLREKLGMRFPEFGTDRLLNCIGNFLNPSLKGCHLKVVNKLDKTRTDMEEMLIEWNILQGEVVEEEMDTGEAGLNSPAAKLSVTDMLKKRLKEEEEAKANRLAGRTRLSAVFEFHPENRPFQRECTSYELLPDAQSSVDQLQWWKNHAEQFPLLAGLVRVVFGVPVASSKSERVFSVCWFFRYISMLWIINMVTD